MSLLSVDYEHGTQAEAAHAADEYEAIRRFVVNGPVGALAGFRLIVVGGGIVGMMAAYFAALAGASVAVYEAQSVGGAASGRNGGGIYACGRRLGEVPLARLSVDTWQDLSAAGLEVHFQRRGHAIIALNELEWDALQRSEPLYARSGVRVDLLDGRAAARRLPFVNPGVIGALLSLDDGQGYAFTAIDALRRQILGRGGEVHPRSPVREILVRGHTAGVRTDTGDVFADAVLLAAGPWTSEFGSKLDVPLPVRPRRSQLVVTERVRSDLPFPFVSGNLVYARQTHEGNLLIGGGGAWEADGFDTTTSVRALAKYARYVPELFPGLARAPVIRAFAGTVELTPDHYPLLGPVPGISPLWVSAGYNGHGFGLSAAAGKLFARMLSSSVGGEDMPQHCTDAITRYRPGRFPESV